jgi:ribosome-binding factor A
MSESRRSRLEGELHRILSELISRAVKDPRVGNVTITAVALAPDLSVARVYFVPFAGRHTPDQVSTGLTRAGGFLRGEVGRRLGLRHAPRLEFLFDEQLDRARQLTDLIEGAVKSDRERSPDPSEEPPR